jgi:hypothetical protein
VIFSSISTPYNAHWFMRNTDNQQKHSFHHHSAVAGPTKIQTSAQIIVVNGKYNKATCGKIED